VKATGWAPLPPPPKITVVVSAADRQAAIWNYTTGRPPAGWMDPGFDDSAWNKGKSGFGTAGTPGSAVGTTWKTADIWLRRDMNLPAQTYDELQGWLHHDEDAEVYINGVLAIRAGGFITGYDVFPLTPQGKAALKPGENLIAIHCHQTVGGQYVDFGLVDVQAN
jgi:hypothetical protein